MPRRLPFGLLVALLIVVHVFPLSPETVPGIPAMVGPIPWDLLYALVWMALAWATIIVLVRRVWNDPHAEREGP